MEEFGINKITNFGFVDRIDGAIFQYTPLFNSQLKKDLESLNNVYSNSMELIASVPDEIVYDLGENIRYPNNTVLFLNGEALVPSTHYVISGSTLTLDTSVIGYKIDPGDRMVLLY